MNDNPYPHPFTEAYAVQRLIHHCPGLPPGAASALIKRERKTHLRYYFAIAAARMTVARDPVLAYQINLDTITGHVTKRLRRNYKLDMTEATSAAGIGIATARTKLNIDKLKLGQASDATRAIAGYLKAKGMNAAIDELRSSRVISRFRNGRYEAPQVQIVHGEDYHTKIDPHTDTRELSDIIPTALGILEGVHRDVIQLGYVEGLDMHEIATKLNITPSYVYQIRKNALATLREVMMN